jgi:hypothetical protein
MLNFVDEMSDWYEDVKKIPNETLLKIVRMGSRILRLPGF